MRRIFLAVLLAVIVAVPAVNAENFTDYRKFLKDNSPEKFEAEADLLSLYPDSLILFSKEYRLLWELTGIKGFYASGGRLTALFEDDDIIRFDPNICGGIVVPDDVQKFVYDAGFLVASSDKFNYFYFLDDCVMYHQTPGKSGMLALSGRMLCEADAGSRTVRHMYTGGVLFYDEPDFPVLGVYAGTNGCYYVNENGNIELFDAKSGQMVYHTFINENVSGIKTTEKGFSGFSGDLFFTVDISEYGTLLEFDNVSSAGKCVAVEGDRGLICEALFYEKLFGKTLDAKRVYIGTEDIYILTGTTLRAYRKSAEWTKKMLTIYQRPDPCLEPDGTLYFKNYLGDALVLESGKEIRYAQTIPESCDGSKVRFNDGSFFSEEGEILYDYASPVAAKNGHGLYKRVENDDIIYIINDPAGSLP